LLPSFSLTDAASVQDGFIEFGKAMYPTGSISWVIQVASPTECPFPAFEVMTTTITTLAGV